MASEGKSDGATGGAGGVGTPRRAQAALSESKAREVMTEEAKKAAPLGWWPTGSSPEDLKFMLESVMSIVERQNTTIRRLQAQVTELWRENTLRGKSSAFDKSEKLVVVGFTRYVEAYSHDTNDWREMPSMPTARRDCAVASCGGKLYVIGGTSSSTGRVVGTVEVYDPVTRVWSEAAPLRKRESAFLLACVLVSSAACSHVCQQRAHLPLLSSSMERSLLLVEATTQTHWTP